VNLPELYDIFRQLVMYAPAVKPGIQLNTFAVIDKRDQLSSETLALQYEDYLTGTFWARDFAYGGAIAHSFKKQYPLLTLEVKAGTLESIRDNSGFWEVFVSVLDTPDCGGILHEQRTREQVYLDNFWMLDSALAELFTFQMYDVVENPGDPVQTVWMSEGRAAFVSVDSITPLGVDFSAHTGNDSITRYKDPYFSLDGAYAVTTAMRVLLCHEEPVQYEYDIPAPDRIGIVAHK